MPTRKNDRPNRISVDDCLYVHNLARIPSDYASKTEWRRRGYKIKKNKFGKRDVESAGWVEYWNVRSYLCFDLFHHPSQTEPIRGRAAEMRRKKWGDESKQVSGVQPAL